jgi:hypothetical protein
MSAERELEAAVRIAAKYAPRRGEDNPARLRRLAGALRRRGFTFDVIEAAVGRLRGSDAFR